MQCSNDFGMQMFFDSRVGIMKSDAAPYLEKFIEFGFGDAIAFCVGLSNNVGIHLLQR
jgi:hypothetical protein